MTCLLLMAAFASGCVVYDQSRGHGRGLGHARAPIVVEPVVVEPIVVAGPHVGVAPAPVHVTPAPVHVTPAPVTFSFSDHHRSAVRNYYSHNRSQGRGHNKWRRKQNRGHGPPAWVRRGGHMPQGIAMQAVPHDLATQLPPAPHGTQFIYYGDHVLLVEEDSLLVLDSISISAGF